MQTTRGIPSISKDILSSPEKLQRYLSQIEQQLAQTIENAGRAPTTNSNVFIDLAAIRSALSMNGEYPLSVTGLTGLLADAQISGLLVASSEPPASQHPVGTLMVLTGSPDTFKYCKAGNPNTWQAISTAPVNMMTLDTPQTVVAAAIKTIQATWIFEVAQNIVNALDANLFMTVQNTNGAGTSAAGVMRTLSSSVTFNKIAHGAGRVLARCGITLGSWAELFVSAGSGLLINIAGAMPIVFGTNGSERMRINGAGAVTIPGSLAVTAGLTSTGNFIAGLDMSVAGNATFAADTFRTGAEVGEVGIGGPVSAATQFPQFYRLFKHRRTGVPTVTLTATTCGLADTLVTAVAADAITVHGFRFYLQSSAAGDSRAYRTYTTSA